MHRCPLSYRVVQSAPRIPLWGVHGAGCFGKCACVCVCVCAKTEQQQHDPTGRYQGRNFDLNAHAHAHAHAHARRTLMQRRKQARTCALKPVRWCAYAYSTTPRNGNPVNENHLVICLLSSRKNGNSLTIRKRARMSTCETLAAKRHVCL